MYHGTSARHLKRILREGLKPRARRKGNWKHSIDSSSKAIYLTQAYSLYYSLCACKLDKKDNTGLILEIDSTKLNPFKFCPDEDFMEQATREHLIFKVMRDALPEEKRMYGMTEHFRDNLESYSEYWQLSLEHLGNCCHMGAIPLEAVSRYAVLPDIVDWVAFSDPTITLMNFRVMGDYYKALSAMVFGDEVKLGGSFFKLPMRESFAKVQVFAVGDHK